jgi:HK97 family phage portal protein
MQLLLHGNAYVELLPGADGMPAELFALRPERVSVEPDARGWPMGFLYRAGANSTRLTPDRLVHIRTHHPLDDHYGLGCLDTAAGAMAAHNAATKWNKALLDNAARPSGALVADATETLTADQFVRLKREMEEGFAGVANAGRPMLLEGGLKWQAMSLSPADMDFAGLKAAAAREIALAFGVPPVLLGLPGDATYANYREANRALWRQAILPLAGKILDALAEGLSPWFAGLRLAVDLDQVPALSEDRERLWAQVNGADFITVNEKRAMIGLEPLAETRVSEKVETKFNPWHDPDNGQFTFAEGSTRSQGGAGVIDKPGVSMAERPKKPKLPQGAARTADGRTIVNRPTVSYRSSGMNGKGYTPKAGDATLLARVIYAESLSNPEDFEAIGWATVNRVGERQHGSTLDGVVNKRNAFQPLEVGGGPKGGSLLWQETADPEKLTGAKLKGWKHAMAVAEGILKGKIADPTGGATFFISSSIYERGKPHTTDGFFERSLKIGRLVDSAYVSSSKRKTQNHFFVEVPPSRPPARKAGGKKP